MDRLYGLGKLCIFILVFLFIFIIGTSPILANPTDGQVVAGNATITTPTANTVQINQASDKVIID